MFIKKNKNTSELINNEPANKNALMQNDTIPVIVDEQNPVPIIDAIPVTVIDLNNEPLINEGDEITIKTVENKYLERVISEITITNKDGEGFSYKTDNPNADTPEYHKYDNRGEDVPLEQKIKEGPQQGSATFYYREILELMEEILDSENIENTKIKLNGNKIKTNEAGLEKLKENTLGSERGNGQETGALIGPDRESIDIALNGLGDVEAKDGDIAPSNVYRAKSVNTLA